MQQESAISCSLAYVPADVNPLQSPHLSQFTNLIDRKEPSVRVAARPDIPLGTTHATMAAEPTVPMPPRELEEINIIDNSLTFPTFTANTAWTLGSLLRTRLLAFSKPVVIDITLANNNHCLFHATTHSGTAPDNDSWVARKRNTVLRFGASSWYMHNKFKGDETAFGAKYALGARAAEYAIHGGGWPVRVQGVEGVIAVIVVSGLKQEQDHGIIVQIVREYLEELGIEMGEKKKED